MNETTTAAGPDRAAIRAELEATEVAYRQLVGEIGEANWKTRSGIPAWTCGQLAWHLASSTGFIAGQIEGASKGKGTNPPAFLMPLIFKASEVRVRIASRKATPASVLADFDAGMKRVLALLDATDDQTLPMSAKSFLDARTVAEMFHIPRTHFAEHSADIRKVLGGS
jgi:uncharacterized protein (TIGR03083 family)